MKAVRSVIVLNAVPYLDIMSVGSHSMTGTEEKGRKDRTDKLTLKRIKPRTRKLEFIKVRNI